MSNDWKLILVLAIAVIFGWMYLPTSRVYDVYAVSSHYEHENENSETTLVVYKSGHSGSVEKIFCLFPPDFHMDDGAVSTFNGPKPVLTGIEKVRATKSSEQHYIDAISYDCEKVR